MRRRLVALAVVVGSGAAGACGRSKLTTPPPSTTCTGWRMLGLPAARDVVAGGGKAWLLTESGLYRWTATCGWELRSGVGATMSGQMVDRSTEGPLWLDAEHRLWRSDKWEGDEVCGGPPDGLIECYRGAGGESVSRFDDETATWIAERERPAAMPATSAAPSVPAITQQSPDSKLLAMAEDGERAWVVATRTQHQWQVATMPVPELWERATSDGAWTVRQPIASSVGAPMFPGTDAVDELVVDGKRLHAGTSGVALRLDGDTWVAIGRVGRVNTSLAGMAVFDGVPWLANACEVTRHPDARTSETELASDRCFINAMWGRAADDVWVVESMAGVEHFDGRTWSALPGPLASLRAVWGTAADDVWVGGSSLLHWDGSTWTDRGAGLAAACAPTHSELNVTALGGTGAKDVWAVGSSCEQGPFVAHWDGRSWTLRMEGFTMPTALQALVVRGKKDVYAVGDGVHHWNGTTWAPLPAPSGAPLRSVAVTADSLWVGDDHGTIFQRSL